jgi:hypothetical protein
MDNKAIHVVDCFCIHPAWRRKGLGDYLLHELHHMMQDRPHAVFLKEGEPLPIVPYYASIYVYRQIDSKVCPDVTELTCAAAYRIMDIHQQFRPFFMIRRQTENQVWKIYRNGIHHVLCCIQDTYQTLHGKRMGWITAWIESPGITDVMRRNASYQLSNSSVYDMIWMDKIHAGSGWIDDGPFYWYTYQWKPSIATQRSYCFIQ